MKMFIYNRLMFRAGSTIHCVYDTLYVIGMNEYAMYRVKVVCSDVLNALSIELGNLLDTARSKKFFKSIFRCKYHR